MGLVICFRRRLSYLASSRSAAYHMIIRKTVQGREVRALLRVSSTVEGEQVRLQAAGMRPSEGRAKWSTKEAQVTVYFLLPPALAPQ